MKLPMIALSGLFALSAQANHFGNQTLPGEVELKTLLLRTCLRMNEPTESNFIVTRANRRCRVAMKMPYKTISEYLLIAYNGFNNQVFERNYSTESVQWLELTGAADYACPARPFEVETKETVHQELLERARAVYQQNKPLFCE